MKTLSVGTLRIKADELMYVIKDHVSAKAMFKADAYHSYKKLAKEMNKVVSWKHCTNKLCSLITG